MTPDEFRQMALSIPEAIESAHVNHPDFRLGGRVFASLGAPDESWGMVKLTPDEQRTFVAKAPAMFRPCAGAWGRQGYTNVHLASAERPLLGAALDAAARNVREAAKKKKARR